MSQTEERSPTQNTLAERNSRWSRQSSSRIVPWAVFLVSFALLIAHATVTGQLAGPPRNPDAVDYHMIGHGIAKEASFVRLISDGVVSAAYPDPIAVEANWPTEFRDQPTAMRPPVIPLLFATLELGSPNRFELLRVLMSLFVAAAIGLAAKLVQRVAGPFPALILIPLAVAFDWRIREMSRNLLTEAPTTFLVTLFAVLMISLKDKPSFRRATVAGVVLGCACLTRTMTVLWIPAIAGLLLILLWPLGRQRAVTMLLLVSGVAAFVFLPWAVRNIDVTGRFLPLGTQGQIELPTGFSDAAWARRGVWFNQREQGAFRELDDRRGIEWEVAAADLGSQQGGDWLVSHPFKAAILGGMKVYSELVNSGMNDYGIIAGAMLGLIVLGRSTLSVVVAGLTVACMAAVALTWSVLGRFIWPMLPLWHALFAIGIWATLIAVTDLRPLLIRTALLKQPCQSNNTESSTDAKERRSGM